MDKLILILVFASFYHLTVADLIVAYDCNQPRMNMTSISTVTTPQCDLDGKNITVSKTRVAITQSALFREVSYIRCLVITRNFVSRCGKTIDTIHAGAMYSEVLDISRSDCETLVNKKQYRFISGNGPIDIKIEHGQTRTSLVSRGYISEGSCTPGIPFTKNGIVYDRPIVNTELEIRQVKGKASIDLEEKTIKIEGKQFELKPESAFDADLGTIFWKIPRPDCSGDNPKSLIYEGAADLVTDISGNRYIQVTHSGYDFQILLENYTLFICGLASQKTEHPKLFVTLLNEGQPSLNLKNNIKPSEVSMLNYINSKIVYSYRHVRDNVVSLYQAFKQDRCKTHNRITENLMTLATTSPKEFAYAYGGQGYTAVTRGEIVYLAKCTPVAVIPDLNQVGCFNEMPVLLNNKTLFMTPRSRILIPVGTPVDCLPDMMPKFKVGPAWYHISPHGLMRSPDPQTIVPDSFEYHFVELKGITQGGLYSSAIIEKYQKAIVSPMMSEVITSRVASSVEGAGVMPEGYSISNAFGEKDFSIIGSKIGDFWSRLSQGMQKTGSWFGFLIFTFACYKCVIYLLSCLINYRELRKEVGCLLAIPLCLVEAVANMVFHGRIFKKSEKPTGQEMVPLASAPIDEGCKVFIHPEDVESVRIV